MLQPHEIEERASEARAILNSKVYQDALEDLLQEYQRTLIQCDVGSLTAATAHASMKVLDGVSRQLQVYINEATVQRKK